MTVTLTTKTDDQVSKVEELILTADLDEKEFVLFPEFSSIGLNSIGISADDGELYFSMLENPAAEDWIQFLGFPVGDPNPWKERDNAVANISTLNYRRAKIVRNGAVDGDIKFQISRVHSKALYT